MIKLEARRKYFFYSIIRWLITGLCSLPVIVYGLICFIQSLLNKTSTIQLNQNLFIYLSLPALGLNIFFIIFGAFYKKKLRHNVISETYKIVSLIKLPIVLPKVVYVYTCHGDMMPARVLQNSLQTYKNMEVWISEGSEKPDVVEKSRKFANEQGFNFYSVGGKGSNNKAENLNSFLKNVRPEYDYLLITDADEALDKNFVLYAIKCFKCPQFKNLGYVSALNYCYETTNLFSNVCCNSDNSLFYRKDFNRTFTFNNTANLYSSSSLISKKLLAKNNYIFPDGCLEDIFLESIAVRHGFTALLLPIAPAGQSFDKDIYKYINRFMRISDWSVKLSRDHGLKKYNEKYKQWFDGTIINVFLTPFFRVLIVLILIVVIWLIWSNQKIFFNNNFFIYMFISIITTAIFSWIFTNIIDSTQKTSCNKWVWLWLLLKPFFRISVIPYFIQHLFKSICLHQYSAFGGSNQKPKKTNRNNVLFSTIGLVISLVCFLAIVLSFIYCVGFKNQYFNLGFLFGVVIFGIMMMSFLSQLILFSLTLLKINPDYDPNKFIQPRKFYEFKEFKTNLKN